MTHRILVVDDDDDVRRLAVMALARVGGYEVTSVPSGAECLAALADGLPDAIVLDVMMPGMDGPTTLHALQDHPTRHAMSPWCSSPRASWTPTWTGFAPCRWPGS